VYARAEVCSGARPAVERAGGFGRVETKCQDPCYHTLMASKGGGIRGGGFNSNLAPWEGARPRGLAANFS
jgi:hypothetical protein